MVTECPFLVSRSEVHESLERERLQIIEEASRPFDAEKQEQVRQAMRQLMPQLANVEGKGVDDERARAQREERRARNLDPARIDEKLRRMMPGLVVEKLSKAIASLDDLASVKATLGRATQGQAAIYVTDSTDSEISNGGFGQYFFNSTGVLAGWAVEGFRTLGATDRADLLVQVMAFFPDGVAPTDRAERMRLLLASSEPARMGGVDLKPEWELLAKPIEKQYYALKKGKRLSAIQVDYIEANPGEFFLDP